MIAKHLPFFSKNQNTLDLWKQDRFAMQHSPNLVLLFSISFVALLIIWIQWVALSRTANSFSPLVHNSNCNTRCHAFAIQVMEFKSSEESKLTLTPTPELDMDVAPLEKEVPYEYILVLFTTEEVGLLSFKKLRVSYRSKTRIH